MRLKVFENSVSNLWAENRLVKFVVVVIACVQIYNAVVLKSVMNNRLTVLVPAGLDKRVQIQGDRASADYIRMFARVTSNLAFNYQYNTAKGQFTELLSFFSPESYPIAEKAFRDLASSIETNKVNSSFTITKSIVVDPDKGTISVGGVQRQWVDGLGYIDPKNSTGLKSYIIAYKFIDGRFNITNIMETGVDGSVAKGGKTAPDNELGKNENTISLEGK